MSYLLLHRCGELARRARAAWAELASCRLCPRACGVNRLQGERGACGVGAEPVVASWNVHHGEEPPISGTRGSGTIFFSGCSGRCLFCQNYPISQLGVGRPVTVQRLAGMMLELQRRGCHNINFVTPTHFVPAILRATDVAARAGLNIPLVYNSSGFESLETLALLEGVIDVYLPDAKYASDAVALEVSGFPGYVAANRAALKEMARQVGPALVLGPGGLAERGMIVRHLVLPGDLAGTAEVLRWLAREISPQVPVSLMSQYFPAHRALQHPLLGRKLTEGELEQALACFEAAGLAEGWLQEPFEDGDHQAVSGWERARHSAA
ncbi:MAG: radical SAM protein [Anaerolineae bacterium]|nr:radical SAM protein [Anaerolineae bacterium]